MQPVAMDWFLLHCELRVLLEHYPSVDLGKDLRSCEPDRFLGSVKTLLVLRPLFEQ